MGSEQTKLSIDENHVPGCDATGHVRGFYSTLLEYHNTKFRATSAAAASTAASAAPKTTNSQTSVDASTADPEHLFTERVIGLCVVSASSLYACEKACAQIGAPELSVPVLDPIPVITSTGAGSKHRDPILPRRRVANFREEEAYCALVFYYAYQASALHALICFDQPLALKLMWLDPTFQRLLPPFYVRVLLRWALLRRAINCLQWIIDSTPSNVLRASDTLTASVPRTPTPALNSLPIPLYAAGMWRDQHFDRVQSVCRAPYLSIVKFLLEKRWPPASAQLQRPLPLPPPPPPPPPPRSHGLVQVRCVDEESGRGLIASTEGEELIYDMAGDPGAADAIQLLWKAITTAHAATTAGSSTSTSTSTSGRSSGGSTLAPNVNRVPWHSDSPPRAYQNRDTPPQVCDDQRAIPILTRSILYRPTTDLHHAMDLSVFKTLYDLGADPNSRVCPKSGWRDTLPPAAS